MTTQQTEALQCAADLEAQLEAIGTGGVSGPLIGQPQAMPDLSQLTERGAKAWAGVDAQALREGNARYEALFGRVFLIRAKGRSGEEILQALHARLENSEAQEVQVALEQLREITLLRLEGVINE